MRSFLAICFLVFSTAALATPENTGPCTKGETKLVFAKKAFHPGLVVIQKPQLCLHGQTYRIMAAQTSASAGSTIYLASGLCRALGFGSPTKYGVVTLRKAERLAHFNDDGSLLGVFTVYPEPAPGDLTDYVISSINCER